MRNGAAAGRYRSIGRQVLLPIAGIQAATVICVALAAAYFAAARAEREILARIAGAAETVERATFPLTSTVVDQMRRLSGTEFVVFRDDGRVSAATIPGLSTVPEAVAVGFSARSISNLPRLDVAGRGYFAVRLRARDGAEVLALTPEETLRRARWESVLPPLVLGVGSLGLMTAATYVVASRIGRRLGAVRSRVARVAEGDFVDLDPGPRRDEIHDLSVSVNHMCARLRSMSESIARSERDRLLAQVAAGLAHSLRNSIGGARMSIQLHAKRSPARDGDLSLEVALRQLTMTEGRVRGLLALGKIESRLKTLCRLDLILEEVARLVEPSATHAGVRLVADRIATGGPVELVADESELQAAVLNLALNAVEAVGNGGRVEIGLSSDGNQATIEVADDGPGPPPELSDRLFEPFVTGKAEGVGLGLVLARHVAVEHGGGLAWSREAGRTIFRLTLPILKPTRFATE